VAAVSPAPRAGGIEAHHVLKDGELVAVLTANDGGETFTVVTEVFQQGAAGPESVSRRPYTFARPDEGQAFLAEAVTSFTYLGCEVRQP
jgi:hypothetical protein